MKRLVPIILLVVFLTPALVRSMSERVPKNSDHRARVICADCAWAAREIERVAVRRNHAGAANSPPVAADALLPLQNRPNGPADEPARPAVAPAIESTGSIDEFAHLSAGCALSP